MVYPIDSHRQEFLTAVASNQAVVLEGPTGSGKTTRLPVFLQEAGYAQQGIIGVTQPRKISATSVCRRIADVMKWIMGRVI